MSLSIPPSMPIEACKFFERQTSEESKVPLELASRAWELKPERLPENRCHLFFLAGQPSEELLIATALEYFCFHPSNPKIHARFERYIIKHDIKHDIDLMWVSFPKEFIPTCHKAAATFGMTLVHKSRMICLGGDAVKMPRSEHSLIWQGKSSLDPKALLKRCDEIIAAGNHCNALGVD